jgi:hypothetical protein
MVRWTGATAFTLGLVGCAASPDTPTPGSAVDAGSAFADVVLSYTVDHEPHVCSDALPACGLEVPDGGATCGPPEVLGAPDGLTFTIDADGSIDLGFRCGAIVEQGGIGSKDVRIWATVPDGKIAVVEVSDDGVTYDPWVELTRTNQELDLQTIERAYIRYIRIADRSGGGIVLDAVEALTEASSSPVDAGVIDAAL